ncbi:MULTISPECIES: hypothetical protein [unclassified Ekhidna]|jgi:hypothetical protein|uniref:DUF7151 family protein n=1 Tax=unclassified Ekhidna TaxID=2632188 RepID=UPI0032DF9229
MLKITLKSIKQAFLLSFLLIAFSCSEEPVEGTDGVDGTDGFNALVIVDDEASGENCSTGGVKISVGQDANENGTLETDEVTSVSFVCNGSAGTDGSSGPTLFARTSPEEPGENCEAGGTLVEIGADTNGNALLDDNEVQTSFFVCNGLDGADGGSGGENGLTSLIRATPLEDCGANSTTGIRIEIGLDENGNGELDEDPSEVHSTYEICDGADGQDGSDGAPGDDGLNALIDISTFSGDQNGCSNGGIRIAAGLDINEDGTLQGGEELNVEFVCNGANGNDGATGTDGSDGRSVVVSVNADPIECANGGIEIVLEYDEDGDGNGDTSIGSYAICNGADGIGLIIRKSVSDVADCPNGGTLVEIDNDDNGNGLFDDGPIAVSFDVCDGADGSNGSDGTSTAISVTAATTCGSAGGWVFTVGIDSDNNGTPDTNLNNYIVCNGDDGTNGQDGNSDGVYEFYFTEGLSNYGGVVDVAINEETNEYGTSMSVDIGSEANMTSNSILYFPKLKEIVESTVKDPYQVVEAILYFKPVVLDDKATPPFSENWIGIKTLTKNAPLVEDGKATWTTSDGSTAWSSPGAAVTETGGANAYSDMYRLPAGFWFEGTIPFFLSRSEVSQWLVDTDANKGMVITIVDDRTPYRIDLASSSYDGDIYSRPTLYIKVTTNTGGRLSSKDEHYKYWQSLSYEEKLAPLKNRD